MDGHAVFPAGLTAGTGAAEPALVTVEKGEDMAFLSLSEAEFDLSDRGVAGREAAPPIDVFLSTERGAYRAGETVNATILARDAEMKALDGLPMTAPLIRPDGVEYSRMLLAPAGAGALGAQDALGPHVHRPGSRRGVAPPLRGTDDQVLDLHVAEQQGVLLLRRREDEQVLGDVTEPPELIVKHNEVLARAAFGPFVEHDLREAPGDRDRRLQPM